MLEVWVVGGKLCVFIITALPFVFTIIGSFCASKMHNLGEESAVVPSQESILVAEISCPHPTNPYATDARRTILSVYW